MPSSETNFACLTLTDLPWYVYCHIYIYKNDLIWKISRERKYMIWNKETKAKYQVNLRALCLVQNGLFSGYRCMVGRLIVFSSFDRCLVRDGHKVCNKIFLFPVGMSWGWSDDSKSSFQHNSQLYDYHRRTGSRHDLETNRPSAGTSSEWQ